MTQAASILRQLRTMFRWAKKVELVDIDPTLDVPDPETNRSERDRVLDDKEIAALWSICEQLGHPYGQICQLLLLTGQSPSREIGDMSWLLLESH